MKSNMSATRTTAKLEEEVAPLTILDPSLLLLLAFDADELAELTAGELRFLAAVAETDDLGDDGETDAASQEDYQTLMRARLVQKRTHSSDAAAAPAPRRYRQGKLQER